jgi:WD40 repeat protein
VTEPPYERVRQLVVEASRLSDDARGAFLDEACGDDQALRAEVDSLLPHVEAGPGLLDGGVGTMDVGRLAEAAQAAAQREADAHAADVAASLPERIGPFRIVRRLATGGMGTVYEAEQDSPSRRVALKTLRRELISPTLLRRFHRETEILGLLHHPGIAQVYEAGTTEGPEGPLPYFAMELVAGQPLVAWAEAHGLDERARLELFAQVCDAVHHAHGQGVVHRDLKPDNILVTDDGHPKVLDFGVARATDADIQTTTLVTEVGQVMGTLPYMSPEQVAGDPLAVDARSDVYALGVVLFELLAGRRPHDLGRRSMPEAARVIREEDATRLGSVATRYRGDVETIVGKALDKDPARRYGSAAELATDLRRYLSDQPIVAHPPSSFYLLRKFARRHRGLVGGVAAALVALAVGLVFAVRFGLEEAEQRRTAELAVYRATLGAVSTSLEAGSVVGLQAMLDEVPEELRGWEWHHLRSRTTRHLWEVEVHEDPSRLARTSAFFGVPVAFSHDGERVVSLLDERTLGVWAAGSGEPLHRLDVGAPIVPASLTSGPGGIAVLTEEAGLVICDDRAGTVTHTEELPGRPLTANWDPHGGLLAVGCEQGEEGDEERGLLLVGEPGVLAPVARLDDAPLDLAWASGGQALLAYDGNHHAFDARTWERRSEWLQSANFLAVASDPGAGLVAIATTVRDVLLFEPGGFPRAPPRVTLQGHQERKVIAVAVSRDGALVASATRDGSLRLWDGSTGAVLEVHELAGNPQVAISPTGDLVALNAGGTLKVLSPDADAGHVLPGPDAYVYELAWTPDGRTLVSRGHNRLSLAYDVLAGEALTPLLPRAWEGHPRTEWGLSVDGTQMVTVTEAGDVFALDLAADAAHARLATDPMDGAAPHDARLAFWRASGRLDPGPDRAPPDDLAFARRHASRPNLELDPTGRWFVAREGWELHEASSGTFLHLLGGEELVRLEGELNPTGNPLLLADGRLAYVAPGADACFSPDGSRVAITRVSMPDLEDRIAAADEHAVESPVKEGTVRPSAPPPQVFDTATGQLLAELPGHDGTVYGVDWSPDGARLATGGNDATVRIWDAGTYAPLVVLRGHRSYVKAVAWSPDGSTLASASGDGTVRLWSTVSSVERTARVRTAMAMRDEQRPWVEELFATLDDPQAVADAVRAAPELDDASRHEALRVVRELANDWHARSAGEDAAGR